MAPPNDEQCGASDTVPRLIRVRLVQIPYVTYQSYAQKVNNLKIIKPKIVDRRGKEKKTNIEDKEL